MPCTLLGRCIWSFILLLHILFAAPSWGQDGPIFHLDTRDGLSQRIVYDVHEDRNGFLWIATRDGLNRYDGHHFKVFRHKPGVTGSISDSKVMSIDETPDGILWIGTMTGGLNRFDPETEVFRSWTSMSDQDAVNEGWRIDHVRYDGQNALLLITRAGDLVEFDLEKETFRKVPLTVYGMPATTRLKVLPQEDGAVLAFCRWMDPESAGVITTASRVNIQNGICEPFAPPFNNVGDIQLAGSSIFVAVESNVTSNPDLFLQEGLHVFEYSSTDLELVRHMALPGVKVGGVYSLHVDESRMMWITGLEDVIRIHHAFSDSARIESLSDSPFNIPSSRSFIVTRDSESNLWVGTHAGLTLQKAQRMPFKQFGDPGQLPLAEKSNWVSAITPLDAERTLIGTTNGLYLWDGRPTSPGTPIMIPVSEQQVPSQTQEVRSLLRLSNGRVLVGTSSYLYSWTQGESRLRPDPGYRASVERPPFLARWPRRIILDMIEDRKKQVWVAGSNQIMVGDLNGAWHSKVSFSAEGVASMSTHNLANTLFEDSQGTIWMGNDNGLFRIEQTADSVFATRPAGWNASLSCASAIWDIEELASQPGLLWLASAGGGLLTYDITTGEQVCLTTSDGLPSNMVYALQRDERDGLWFSTTTGLGYRDPESGGMRTFTTDQGLHDDEFDLGSSAKSPDGTLFFGGPTGMTMFRPELALAPDERRPLIVSEVSVFGEPRPGTIAEGDVIAFRSDEQAFSVRLSTLNFGSLSPARFRYRLADISERWIPTEPTTQSISFNNLGPGLHRLEIGYLGEPPGSSSDTFVYLRISPPFWRSSAFYVIITTFLVATVVFVFRRSRASIQREERRKLANAAELARIVASRTEEERGDVARTLHDGPIQTLYALNHQLEAGMTDSTQTRQTLLGIAEEIRDVCDQLRPKALEVLGVLAALDGLMNRVKDLAPDMNLEFRLAPELRSMPIELGEHAYWIAQTSLSNVIRHAHASKVSVFAGKVQERWLLRIEDNGHGFILPNDLIEFAEERHFGLIGIRERVDRVGGEFRIRSRPGKGTLISVSFPLST